MAEQKSNTQLINMVDILWVPLTFYVLTQWSEQDSWQEHVGLLLVFFLVQVEYLSIKQSYYAYNLKFYILDFVSFGIYFSALAILTSGSTSEIGYNPNFWGFISFLWLGHSFWDFEMRHQKTDADGRALLKWWGIKMAVFFVVGITCFIGLRYMLGNPSLPGRERLLGLVQIIPLLLVISAVVEWLKDVGKFFDDG